MGIKEQQFHISLPLPPTDNHLYGQKGKIRFMYSDAKRWKEESQTIVKEIWESGLLEGELMADIVFFLKRDRDVMGSSKLIFDTFQGILYKNDNQFTHVNLHKVKDANPRVEITIEKL